MAKRSGARSASLKPAVFVLCLLPLIKLAFDAYEKRLSANPIAEALNRLGYWTLFLLFASLAASPLKTVLRLTFPIRVRRMLGLFAFFYGVLHFATYIMLDQSFDFADILRDIAKRKFITVGFAALVLLVPLAVTSTDGSVKRLGYRKWKAIHRLAYASAVLGVVHFIWRVKADLLVPLTFAIVLFFLLGIRVVSFTGRARAAR